MTFETNLNFGDRVTVDGDMSLTGTIVSFKYMWRGAPLVEISYFHNGEQKYALVEEARLVKATH